MSSYVKLRTVLSLSKSEQAQMAAITEHMEAEQNIKGCHKAPVYLYTQSSGLWEETR